MAGASTHRRPIQANQRALPVSESDPLRGPRAVLHAVGLDRERFGRSFELPRWRASSSGPRLRNGPSRWLLRGGFSEVVEALHLSLQRPHGHGS